MSICTKISSRWISLFSFFDDKGRARHPLVISRKNNKREANLLYWKNHYASIANISRHFSDLIKGNESTKSASAALNISRLKKCLIGTKCFALEATTCRSSLCSRGQDPNRRKSNSTCTSIVLRRHLSSMRTFSPSLSHTVARWSNQLHPAAQSVRSSDHFHLEFYNFDQRIVLKVGKNALCEFLDTLIVWEAGSWRFFGWNGRYNFSVPASYRNMIMPLCSTSAVTSS